jgi:spermidine/putrescine transport system permease protein
MRSIKYAGCWPAAAVLMAGILLPLCVIAYVSVCAPLDFGGVEWGKLSGSAYQGLLFEHDFDGAVVFRSAYLLIFARSLLFATLTTLLCLITGLPTALYIATQPPERRPFLLVLIAAPFAVSLVVRAYGWVILLADGGMLNHLLNRVFPHSGELGLLYSDTATMIGLVYIFFPFMVLPLYASLRDLDWEVAEAAGTLGAPPWRVLTRVIVPACRPGIGAGVALIFVPALGSYVIPDLLGGAKSMMVGNLVQLAFTSDRNWPLGASLSVALLLIVLAVTWLARRGASQGARARGGREPGARFPGVSWVAVPMFAFLYLPMLALVATSFNAGASSLIWTGLGLHGYREAWGDENLLRAASTSLLLAGSTVVIVTLAAVPAAVALRASRSRLGAAFEEALKIPLTVPEIVLAVATLLGFAAASLELGFASVLFAHVVFCLPIAYLPIRASLAKVDPDLLDAAATLSATPWTTFWRVTLPLIWPGIATGAVLSFVTSLDDFVTTYFVAGAGVLTLPTYIYGALKVGLTPKISAISTLVIVASMALVSISALINKQRQARERPAPEAATPALTGRIQLAREAG